MLTGQSVSACVCVSALFSMPSVYEEGLTILAGHDNYWFCRVQRLMTCNWSEKQRQRQGRRSTRRRTGA